MATLYDLKPAFQRLLRPTITWLAGAGVTANQVTLAAAALSGVGGAVIAWGHERRWPLLLIPVVLFVRMALNAIDGQLAREHDMQSRLGAVLNELGDVVSDAVLYLPFAWIAGVSGEAVVTLVFLALVTEMTGVVGVQIGAERRYDGPFGKSDRAFLFGALALGLGARWLPVRFVDPVLWMAVALAAWTCVNRARAALRQAAEREGSAT